MRFILTVVLSLALLGCAAVVPLATPTEDAEAKAFTPHKTEATIYVFRDDPMKGAARTLPVLIDGKMIGASAARTFLRFNVPAGKHTLASPAGNFSAITIDARPGAIYYVRHVPRFELLLQDISGEFEVTSESDGKASIAKCTLAVVMY